MEQEYRIGKRAEECRYCNEPCGANFNRGESEEYGHAGGDADEKRDLMAKTAEILWDTNV